MDINDKDIPMVIPPKGGTDLSLPEQTGAGSSRCSPNSTETSAWISNSKPAIDSVADLVMILQNSIDEIREIKSEIGRVYFLFQRLLRQTDRRRAPYDPQYPGERRIYIKSELEHQARAGDNDGHR